jgi:hypothetical protein
MYRPRTAPGARAKCHAGRRESAVRRSSPCGLGGPVENDGGRLLGAATLGRNGEKPLSVRRHREVVPGRAICPSAHSKSAAD